MGIEVVMEEQPALLRRESHLLCPHHQRSVLSKRSISSHQHDVMSVLVLNCRIVRFLGGIKGTSAFFLVTFQCVGVE